MPKHIELETKLKNSKFSLYKLGDSFISSQIVDGPFGSDLKVNEYVESGVPLLRVSNCRDGIIKTNDEMVFISLEKHLQLSRSEVLPNDVLLTKAGAILGYSAVFPFHLERGNITSHLVSIRPTQNIESRFLSDFLTSRLGNQQIYRWGNKSTRPELNTDEVKKILILVPPIAKQTELVAAMDEARSQRKQKLTEAEALLSSLDQFILDTLNFRLPPPDNRKVYATTLSRMIGERIDSYSNKPYFQKLFNAIQNSQHNISTLSNLSIRIFSGTTPLAKGDAYVDPPNGVRFIRSGEITTEGTVTPTSEVHISDEIHTGKMKSSQLQKGDLLIAIVGATIGAVGIYDLNKPANINQAIASVRLSNKEVLGEYICWYLRSSIGQRLLDYFKRPVARANINLAEVGEIPIIIPDLQIQETIIKEVDNRRSEAQRLRSEAETGWQAAKQWFEDQLLGGS